MTILFDTNVVLDVLLDRQPFSEEAAQLFSMVETKKVVGVLGATTVTTVHYLANKAVGPAQAEKGIRGLLDLFEVAPVHKGVLTAALGILFSDFEDAVLHEAARLFPVDAIVTRNPRDFKGASLSVYAPDELLGIFAARRR